LFEAFAAAVPADISVEVVIVDNGSTDETAIALPALLAAHPFTRSVKVDVNRGYGHGILTGLRAASGATVGWTHADLQTDPVDVFDGYRRYRRELADGRVLVKGRRTERPLFDRLFTAGMGIIASLALGGRFADINAQPKLFPRRIVEDLHDAPLDFSLDLYLLWLAGRKGLTVVDFPVAFGRRTQGEAKGGGSLPLKWKLTRRTLTFIRALRTRVRAEGS
jgi:glycosyltransferase involved in cell wall biosynthesis